MNEESKDIVLGAETSPAVLQLVPFPASFQVRVYFSLSHLLAAKHFAQLAADSEASSDVIPRHDEKHRAYVVGAIISAVAFLEAAVNEVLRDVKDEYDHYIGPIGPEAKNRIAKGWDKLGGTTSGEPKVLNCCQKILKGCSKELFTTGSGARPYDNARLVINLRNSLVHYEPGSYGPNDQPKCTEKLEGKFSDNPLMAGTGNPYFPAKCLGSPCANWAIDSVEKLADEFFQRIDVIPPYFSVKASSDKL